MPPEVPRGHFARRTGPAGLNRNKKSTRGHRFDRAITSAIIARRERTGGSPAGRPGHTSWHRRAMLRCRPGHGLHQRTPTFYGLNLNVPEDIRVQCIDFIDEQRRSEKRAPGADLEQQNLVVSIVSVVRDREQLPAGQNNRNNQNNRKKMETTAETTETTAKTTKTIKQWACCFWPVSPVVFVVLWTPLF